MLAGIVVLPKGREKSTVTIARGSAARGKKIKKMAEMEKKTQGNMCPMAGSKRLLYIGPYPLNLKKL